MNKQQATAQISKLLIDNQINIEKAQALADEFDIEFSFESPDGTSVSYVPENGIRPTVEQYWENGYCEPGEDGVSEEWDGDTYAGWQNSSTFC